MTELVVLWHQCPISKWHRQTTHQRPTRADMDLNAVCYEQVEEDDINLRSGRVVRNTSRYEQSISQRNQGLVAWEVLLNQDEQENVPTAASQYNISGCLESPLAFTASNNPDILYWDLSWPSSSIPTALMNLPLSWAFVLLSKVPKEPN